MILTFPQKKLVFWMI